LAFLAVSQFLKNGTALGLRLSKTDTQHRVVGDIEETFAVSAHPIFGPEEHSFSESVVQISETQTSCIFNVAFV
jgi:hypothetical protein